MSIDWHNMTDNAFLVEAEQQIWLSAFASNNPRAPAHKAADDAYDEALRRGKPWLYQRAWNAAYRSCGYEPSDEEMARAKPPEDLPEPPADIASGEVR